MIPDGPQPVQVQARIAFLREELERWEKFVQDNGGPDGYVALFGHSRDVPGIRFGPGGNRLYEGDRLEVECLHSRLRQTIDAAREQERLLKD